MLLPEVTWLLSIGQACHRFNSGYNTMSTIMKPLILSSIQHHRETSYNISWYTTYIQQYASNYSTLMTIEISRYISLNSSRDLLFERIAYYKELLISCWSSILSDLRHIVIYMLYIEKYCMKFLDGVVLMTRSMVSLSLILYCNQNWTCNSSRWQPLLLVTSDSIQLRRMKYKLFCQIKVTKKVNREILL